MENGNSCVHSSQMKIVYYNNYLIFEEDRALQMSKEPKIFSTTFSIYTTEAAAC